MVRNGVGMGKEMSSLNIFINSIAMMVVSVIKLVPYRNKEGSSLLITLDDIYDIACDGV